MNFEGPEYFFEFEVCVFLKLVLRRSVTFVRVSLFHVSTVSEFSFNVDVLTAYGIS